MTSFVNEIYSVSSVYLKNSISSDFLKSMKEFVPFFVKSIEENERNFTFKFSKSFILKEKIIR